MPGEVTIGITVIGEDMRVRTIAQRPHPPLMVMEPLTEPFAPVELACGYSDGPFLLHALVAPETGSTRVRQSHRPRRCEPHQHEIKCIVMPPAGRSEPASHHGEQSESVQPGLDAEARVYLRMTDAVAPRSGMTISIRTRRGVVVVDPERFLAAARQALRDRDALL